MYTKISIGRALDHSATAPHHDLKHSTNFFNHKLQQNSSSNLPRADKGPSGQKSLFVATAAAHPIFKINCIYIYTKEDIRDLSKQGNCCLHVCHGPTRHDFFGFGTHTTDSTEHQIRLWCMCWSIESNPWHFDQESLCYHIRSRDVNSKTSCRCHCSGLSCLYGYCCFFIGIHP